MKKTKIIYNLLLLALFMLTISKVNAQCMNDYVPNPQMPQVYGYSVAPINQNYYSLTSAQSTCTGPNTAVYFGSLKAWSEAGAGSQIFVDLYEYDVPPNDDDWVKDYRLIYNSSGYYYKIDVYTKDYGNIDSEGDPTAELYLRFYSSGFQYHYTPAGLFTFHICMN